jgi:hypothetical protein
MQCNVAPIVKKFPLRWERFIASCPMDQLLGLMDKFGKGKKEWKAGKKITQDAERGTEGDL